MLKRFLWLVLTTWFILGAASPALIPAAAALPQKALATNWVKSHTQASEQDTALQFAALPLCLPSIDTLPGDECLAAGPQAYLAEYAAKGWTFPPRPIPGHVPDRSLSQVPHYYVYVRTDNAPVYNSLDSAVAGSAPVRELPVGFQYMSFIDSAEVDGTRYYMVEPGLWMSGKDVSRIATGSYQGLAFDRTPFSTVAWARNQVPVQAAPGYNARKITGRVLQRYDVVQVYDVTQADGVDWYMISLGEWVEGRQISRVLVNTTPPKGVTGSRWIEINLQEQVLAVYDKRQLVFASLVATGVDGFWTRPGLFQIYQKKEAETMQGSFTADRSDFYYLEDVPWTMYFDQARALHAAYWHNRFGFQVSHGCVNMSPGDANWLFSWAEEGDWVYVWDPTGNTPTDADLYGEGGA